MILTDGSPTIASPAGISSPRVEALKNARGHHELDPGGWMQAHDATKDGERRPLPSLSEIERDVS